MIISLTKGADLEHRCDTDQRCPGWQFIFEINRRLTRDGTLFKSSIEFSRVFKGYAFQPAGVYSFGKNAVTLVLDCRDQVVVNKDEI